MAYSGARDRTRVGPAELRERRTALRLTQADLSRSLGVSRNTIARWERGELPIQHPELIHLALGALEQSSTGAARAALGRPAHNLPADLSSFVGREHDSAELVRLLTGTRLLTLSGPGGIGKTRLALRVAARVVDVYPDGVWLAELGALSDDTLVPDAVASALGVKSFASRPMLDALRGAVRERTLLLVLDNCEHMVQACADLSESLLRVSPGLRILATSREPLRVPGEVTWTVPPLSLPCEQGPSLDGVADSEAVRLFVDRARAVQPAFALSQRNMHAAADLCRRLDGIPLAIELAATRVSSLSVEQIAASLDDRFRILTAGPRTAPARHRTLRATVEWSYALLSPVERQVLAALSVFGGGWTLEAARAVCRAVDLAVADFADIHDRLLSKSLIAGAPLEDGWRYRFLDTIRAFALDCLVVSGLGPAVRARHAAYYLELAERAGAAAAQGPVRIPWLAALERDHDNMREALRWTIDTNADENTRVRWAAALGPFWHLRGHVTEGRVWQAALGVTPGRARPTGAWARALTQTGILHTQQWAFDLAMACYDAAVPIARCTADSETLMRLLINIGSILTHRHEYVRAAAALEEALSISRSTGDRVRESFALGILAILLHVQGDLGAAEARAVASLKIADELQDSVLQADFHRVLGNIALSVGERARARAHYEASLSHSRRAAQPVSITRALLGSGHVAYAMGERIRARALLAESLANARDLGLEGEAASALIGLGALAVDRGQSSAGLHLAAAAERLDQTVGDAPLLPPRDAAERSLARARRAVDPAVAAEATLRGQTEWLEETITFALALEPPGGVARASGPLTRREHEVARLIAEGLSNREIATRLVISQRTTATHVEHILAKLGVHSRVEVALWIAASADARKSAG